MKIKAEKEDIVAEAYTDNMKLNTLIESELKQLKEELDVKNQRIFDREDEKSFREEHKPRGSMLSLDEPNFNTSGSNSPK